MDWKVHNYFARYDYTGEVGVFQVFLNRQVSSIKRAAEVAQVLVEIIGLEPFSSETQLVTQSLVEK